MIYSSEPYNIFIRKFVTLSYIFHYCSFLNLSNFPKYATNSRFALYFLLIIVMINIKAVVYLILGTLANKVLIQKVMMNSN